MRLAEYKDLVVSVPAQLKVTDEDVDEQIKTDLIEHRTSADTVERGDYVTIDFVGKIDGKTFENGSADNYTIEVGQNTLIDGFEDGLIGMKSGETKDLHLTFPTDYDKEYAGKDVVFTVTVKSIERTPELTDELAKELDPECNSADEYRTKTKNNMAILVSFLLHYEFVTHSPRERKLHIADLQDRHLHQASGGPLRSRY